MSSRGRRLRRRDEAGYAAVLVALLSSVIFIGMGAFGVDMARWYVEVEQVQKSADAAALAGVTYMPNDLTKARATALASAKRNGYDDAGADVTVTAVVGSRPSELKVTISSRIDNSFGAGLGVRSAWITRSAVADYTAPSLMGSPCNTFGNEPPSTSTTVLPVGTALPAAPFPNCSSTPQFWATVEGPQTDKVNGDRYRNRNCARRRPAINCSGSTNSEYKEEGYFFAIHVEPAAIGTKLDIQLYDPAFVQTGKNCEDARHDERMEPDEHLHADRRREPLQDRGPTTTRPFRPPSAPATSSAPARPRPRRTSCANRSTPVTRAWPRWSRAAPSSSAGR